MRRRRPLAITVLLTLLLVGCGGPDRERARQRAVQLQEQQRLARQRCERDRRLLPPLLSALAQGDDRVAAVEAEGYVPSPGPKPLDPVEQARLAIYDQEVEQEQYDQALAAWQEREQQREAIWRAAHRARLLEARRQREAAAANLHRLYPTLLTGDVSPQLRKAERDRLLSCAEGPR